MIAVNDIYKVYLFNLEEVNKNVGFFDYKLILNKLKNTSYNYESNMLTLLKNLSNNQYIEMDSYFTLTPNDTLKIQLPYSKAIKYNYGILVDSYSENNIIYYFFYIRNYNALNVEVSELTIELDTLTTFMKNIKGFKGNLKRSESISYITRNNENFISTDLFFAEDEPSNDYVIVNKKIPTFNDGGRLVPSLLINMVISRDDEHLSVTENPNFVRYTEGNSYINLCKYDQNGNLASYGVNSYTNVGDFYSVVIVTEDYTFSNFKSDFKTLVDKIISVSVVPFNNAPVDSAIHSGTFSKTINSHACSNLMEDYLIKKTNNDLFSIKNIVKKDATFENKLYLYPYSYWNLMLLNEEVSFKYQDILITNDNVYYPKDMTIYIDPFTTTPSLYLNFYNKYNSSLNNSTTYEDEINFIYKNIDTISLAIYESQYNEYRNYNKAIVDANLQYEGAKAAIEIAVNLIGATISTIGGIALGGVGAVFGASYGMYAIGDTVNKVVSLDQQRKEVAMKEKALKNKPPLQRGKITGQSGAFLNTKYYENSRGEHIDKGVVFINQYSMNENEVRIYKSKFYFNGYAIPIEINYTFEANTIEFITMLGCRKLFNFLSFIDVKVLGDIPYIYKEDIENRLINGVYFMKVNSNNVDLSFKNVNIEDITMYEDFKNNNLIDANYIENAIFTKDNKLIGD